MARTTFRPLFFSAARQVLHAAGASVFVSLAGLLVPATGWAQTCPSVPNYLALVDITGLVGTPGNYSSSTVQTEAFGTYTVGTDAVSTATLYGGASPSASVVSSAGAVGLTEGSSGVNYYLAECGPAGVAPPPLLVSGTVTAGVSGSGSAHAQGFITVGFPGDANYLLFLNAYADTSGHLVGPFTIIDQSVAIPADTVIQVSVVANAGAGGTASGSGSVDPTIEIDPNAPNASEFTLEFSQGIGGGSGGGTTTTGVPEPITAALFSLGLIGVGLSKRKGRRRAA
jgi:hypothetical protein